MKKMKAFKMIGILMAAVMLVSSFTMVGYADSENNTDTLWEQKWEYDQDSSKMSIKYQYLSYFPYQIFYMDVELKGIYNRDGSLLSHFTFPEWEEFEKVYPMDPLTGYGDGIPPMLWLVRELNIPKEKFVEVNNQMKEDPYSICAVLVEKHGFDKAEVDRWFDKIEVLQAKGSVYEDFMIEALYLEDFDEALNLLRPLGWYFIDGKETRLIGRTIDEIIAMGVDIDSNQFRYYIKYLQEKMRTEPDPDAYQHIKRWLKEIENDLNAPPAQTGDAAVVSVIAVCVTTLALSAVTYRRKRTI